MDDQVAQLERVAPQDIEAEKALLGACLVQPVLIDEVVRIIPAATIFYVPAHNVIWRTLCIMVNQSLPIDLHLMRNQLEKQDSFEYIGGSEYLIELAESFADVANAPYYARQVTEQWRRRELIHAATEAMQRAYNTHTEQTAIEIAASTASQLDAVVNSNGKVGTTDLIALLDQLPSKLTGGSREFISTELDLYDKKQGGIEMGSVTVLAAYPSVGKTAFGLHLATVAASAGVPVQFFSLEMSQTALMLRLTASITGHNITHIRLHMSPEDHQAMANAAKLRLDGINMQIIDDVFNVAEIVATARSFAHKHGPGLVVIDYLQIAEPATQRKGSRNDEVAEMSKTFKRLARQTGSAVLVLSQFNRAPAKENRRPQLSDLRDSGSIEQDADVVWFLHNPDKGKEVDRKREADLIWIVEKNRQGDTGQLKLKFDRPTMRFWLQDELAKTASSTTGVGSDSAGFVGPIPGETTVVREASQAQQQIPF